MPFMISKDNELGRPKNNVVAGKQLPLQSHHIDLGGFPRDGLDGQMVRTEFHKQATGIGGSVGFNFQGVSY